MNKLSKEEFAKRIRAVAEARRIFIPHLTKDISIAFEMYLSVFEEKEISLFLQTDRHGNRTQNIMDLYERPKCPECGSDLRCFQLPEKGPNNLYGFATQWVCVTQVNGEYCGYEENPTHKTVLEHMKEFKRK